jgi:peptidoglycan/LPS O-acetylase OafA/YrhL
VTVKMNNFDFLRFLAATAVIISHVNPLHGGFIEAGDLGQAAVYTFFTVSGFLVASSWEKDPNAARFLARRGLRIFPGLLVVVALTAFIIGPIVTTMRTPIYFRDPATWFYLRTAALWPVSYALPGVFASNHYPGAANGSLWTLPIEILMYVSLAILGTLGFFRSRRLLSLVCWSVILVSAYGMDHPKHIIIFTEFDLYWVIREAAPFAFGVLMWIWRDTIPFYRYAWVPIALLAALLHNCPAQEAIMTYALPYAAISFALNPIPLVQSMGRSGDFSYGIYIYGFLIQQTIMHFWPHIGTYAFLAACVAISIMVGACSWHLIEKPTMRLKDFLPPRRNPSPLVMVPERGVS